MNRESSGIVTVMSDLGTVDGYVAAIKGAVLSAWPRTSIVDVTHQIPVRDVTEAAFQLAFVWPVFPPATVHLVIVNTGPSAASRPIAVEIGGHFFVTPDNGLLTLVIANSAPTQAVVLDRAEISSRLRLDTFPGRDVYGPIAGALASGQFSLNDLGTRIDIDSLVRLPWSAVVDSPDRVHAPVVSVDRYGNCRTLITRQHLPGDVSRVLVRCGDVTVRGICTTYGDVAEGKTLALFGSHGGLEIAVRGGNASQSWELSRGDDVIVTRGQQVRDSD